jgi:hypothetical protein
MWTALTWAFSFLSLPSVFPSCISFLFIQDCHAQSTVEVSCFESFSLHATISQLMLRHFLMKSWSTHCPLPSKLLTTVSVECKFLTMESETLHSITCTHIPRLPLYHSFHSHLTLSGLQFLPVPELNYFLWYLFFVHWERISVLGVISPILKVKPRSHPLLQISWFTLVPK